MLTKLIVHFLVMLGFESNDNERIMAICIWSFLIFGLLILSSVKLIEITQDAWWNQAKVKGHLAVVLGFLFFSSMLILSVQLAIMVIKIS